jgi:hypothetical protein
MYTHMVYNARGLEPKEGENSEGRPMQQSTARGETHQIYTEMLIRLQRSTQPSYRIDEQASKDNFSAILRLRQQLIQSQNWGESTREQEFDSELRLSLATQLRLATLHKPFSRQFVCQLLDMFRHLMIDHSLEQHDLDVDVVNDRILSFVGQTAFGSTENPGHHIIRSTQDLLRTQSSCD